MRVQHVMNKSPKFCSPTTYLAAVTELLWSGGCGALPVVNSKQETTCRSTDDIHGALKIMRTRKIRRLPVVNKDGKLEGMVCVSDLIADARHEDGIKPELSYEDVMSALKSINRHLRASVASTH
jgi:predicted transcriptional regulator